MGVKSGNKAARRILTLDQDALQSDMERLLGLVKDAGERPDLLVGVATGGELCGRLISEHFPAGLISVVMRRPSTSYKKTTLIKIVLSSLPYAITNLFRGVEDALLERYTKKVPISVPTDELRRDIAVVAAAVERQGLQSVLVVDDAIDSGATLACIVAELKAALPSNVRIITAVLTQTRPTPAISADFRLYDCVMLRFPWSLDFRGRE
ncbi:phosphoribosyltransferase family protein [Yoonia vestfoldensis]|uniref:Phosphoribosyltransferase domain-containing protein n=1 Tax=Yoonia vestfoldensis SKA53 TaxID=314232 RepID=A3V6A1_9RHOB|nr:phosphoribosyltransferase [Yoonia vestfoldensis]EAQ06425.1 hypothetical protein SKA53_05038 [Yoonia vestfoldensis SKA53]